MLISIREICRQIADDFGITPTKQDIGFCGLTKLREVISLQEEQPNLICVGARAGMGKTVLSLDVALDYALHSDKEAVIFALELSARQLTGRIIQKLCGVDIRKFRNHPLNKADKYKVAAAIAFLQELNISIDDEAIVKPSYIEKCVQNQKNIGLVIIDYIQLVLSDRWGELSTQAEQVETAEMLAKIARKYNTKMLVLTQLRRSSCARIYQSAYPHTRPIIDDIYYSERLAEISDMILFIHRKAYYEPESADDSAEIIVAKNTLGECGVINMRFDEEFVRFKD